jgi:hypothetical protein
MAAVMSDDNGKTFYSEPVCDACWRDPAHRQVTLKASFFNRDQAADAVSLAGERDAKGNPVRTPA